MKVRKGLVRLCVVALALVGQSTLRAQPDANAPGMAANPANQNWANQNWANQNWANQNWANMTPEQRRQALQQFVEQTLRGSMTHLGYPDVEFQNEVIAFSTQQEKMLEPVRDKHRKVAQALINNAAEYDVAVLMLDLRAAIEAARLKRREAIAALDEKIKFSEKPRLAALLSIAGLTGDETQFIGGVVGGIMGTFGNLAAGADGEAARRQGNGNVPAENAQQ